MSDGEDEGEETLDGLLANGMESLERLSETLADSDAIEDLDDDTIESVIGDVDALVRVVEEIGELLEAMDLTDLPEAIDEGEVVDAFEAGSVDEVLADEADATALVDFRELFDAIDLLETWNAADLSDLWQEKRELDDALENLADDADAGTVEKAVSEIARGDERLFGEGGDLLETDLSASEATTEAFGDLDIRDDPEAYQAAIQRQAIEGIDAFRTALLETHERFERLYEFNREKMRRQDTSTNSRNPTAASTIPTDRQDLGGGTRYSTVPRDVTLSTAPTRERIYGRRFELERERRRTTND
ncbi:hypothetical protein [Natrinema caseinilyticum]|uniref:hypothetical protein n=1 Tax=Natrinema caseinilyticum TaxID=2961570 RepID=UPI0020C2C432|nr:hypothetical protein [Natrinema caseinilyticum]